MKSEPLFNPMKATPDDIAGFVGSLPVGELKINLIHAFLKMKEMQSDVDRVAEYLSESVSMFQRLATTIQQLDDKCKEYEADK